jgi:exodeoxyribonuclease VII small subunit
VTDQPGAGQPPAEQPQRQQPGYEQAREELVDVVRRLESGGTTLEESLALWERGEELARICQGWLEGARERLDAALSEREQPGG